MRRVYACAVMMGIITAAGCFLNPLHRSDSLTAGGLRCEYRVDPLGIDAAQPRLSWVLESTQRGQKQTAYQVIAASSEELLRKETGDLWDSGKVAGDETTAVVYQGKSPASGENCFWKVRVWDAKDKASGWSEPAHWSAGLLNTEDWKAHWVGMDLDEKKDVMAETVQSARWIWSQPASEGNQPAGERYFRRGIELPEASVQSAVCYITADDSYELYVNGKKLSSAGDHQSLHKVDCKDALQSGRNTIAVAAKNAGSGPNPAGLIAAMKIETAAGLVTVLTDAQWSTSNEAAEGWQTPEFNDSGWTKAVEEGPYGMDPWGKIQSKATYLPPARYMRKEFTIADSHIRQARLYVTALGIYQLMINGQRVADDYFSPGWTDYVKRVYYRTYDVTEQLESGDNVVGAILADGWYAGYVGYAKKRDHYGRNLRLLAQLVIDYEDGSSQVVATGSDWKGALGPIMEADFLMGERYDARLEQAGWDKSGFDDSAWLPVAVSGNEVDPQVQAAVSEPVRVFDDVRPVSISEPQKGVYVFDMGQNFAGVVRMSVRGKAGQEIKLRFAERLNPDGTMYTTNLRAARATDTYICKGEGLETWQPYFTFHGFQYVEMSGLSEEPSKDMIVGLALSSDTPMTGSVETSDPVVNKIYSNSVWTQRMNFIDVPTDCPQRDERLGWTGDAQVYINTACYITDVQAFFTKWLTDLEDAQRGDGQFPQVAPVKPGSHDGGPAWAEAGVICPWTIYKMYGDKRVLEAHYEAMTKFIAFCKNRSTPELLPPAQFHCFGDWLNIDDDTPKDVIYTAYFAYSTKLTANAAAVLGKPDEAAAYNDLFGRIRAAFNKAYVQEDGKIKGDSQCAYVLAIAYDLVEGDRLTQAAGHLIRKIEQKNWHLSTGFVGTKDLMLVLDKIGRNDVAYRLLHNDTFPSWGFSIKHGATSIWERWNGWTPEQGFGDPGMNSFAHYSFGAVCQWMFENIGGIRTDGSGFKRIVLKPAIDEKMDWSKVSYNSIRGPIETSWKKLGGGLWRYDVTIPPNTTATLYLPTSDIHSVREGGWPIKPAPASNESPSGVRVIELESGRYSFVSKLPSTK